MCQIAENQVSETVHLLTYCHSVCLEWNGPAFSWHDRSEFSTMILVLEQKVLVLVLVLALQKWSSSLHYWVHLLGIALKQLSEPV